MKRIIAIIAVIVIIAASWLIFSSPNPGSTNQNQSNGPSTNSSNSTKATGMGQVKIANMAFTPADVSVKKGTKVTWTNTDAISHTVTENDGQNGPSAPPLGQGQTYSFIFNHTGTFHYHCSIHPEMVGSVTVTD